MKFTITGDSLYEIHKELSDLLSAPTALAPCPVVDIDGADMFASGGAIPEEALVEKPKKKRAKRKTKVKASKKKSVGKTSKEMADLESPKPLEEKEAKALDAHAALQLVNSELGFSPALEILKRFDCKKLSDLQAKDVENFVTACEDACRG